jgi:hypothetical protein
VALALRFREGVRSTQCKDGWIHVVTLICPDWSGARWAAHDSGQILSTQVIALRAGDRRVLAERVHARRRRLSESVRRGAM